MHNQCFVIRGSYLRWNIFDGSKIWFDYLNIYYNVLVLSFKKNMII